MMPFTRAPQFPFSRLSRPLHLLPLRTHLRRLASLLLPQQQQQDKAAAAAAAAARGASESFEEFLQVCVLDASKAAPFPSPGTADSSSSDGSLSRVSVLSRMLARVGAGQESLKQGLPPGAGPCRHAAAQLGKKPPPQVLSQPPVNLQSIRVSIPKPQQIPPLQVPQNNPSALQQPKQEASASPPVRRCDALHRSAPPPPPPCAPPSLVY